MNGDAPHTVLKPPSRWSALELRQVWAFRDLLTRLTIRDLKLRYKQTALGVAWVVIQPLLAAGILAFVFGRVAGLTSEGVPYFCFAYVSMACWNLFSQTLTKSATSLVSNSALVSKVFFPRLVLPLSVVGSTLVDFVVTLGMGGVILAIAGVSPGVQVVLFPVWALGALAIACGIGFASSALMVQYRDVGQILPVLTQLLLYATPVAYAISAVPQDLRWIVRLNPMTQFVSGFRWSMVDTPPPSTGWILYSSAFSLSVFIVGAYIFTRKERQFADII